MFGKRKNAKELDPPPLSHMNAEALAQIKALFDAEWASPTDEAREVKPQ
jgi:hypothetical protein